MQKGVGGGGEWGLKWKLHIAKIFWQGEGYDEPGQEQQNRTEATVRNRSPFKQYDDLSDLVLVAIKACELDGLH